MRTKGLSAWTVFGLCLLLNAGSSVGRGNPRVFINELIQSNIDGLMVEKDFPDSWVELYNEGDSAVCLEGWSLCIDADQGLTYTLGKEAVIEGKGHLVVCCDKVGTGLHTTYRLETGRGKICLYDSLQMLCDSIEHPKMLAPNIAYGRLEDGGELWGHELLPTPGGANNGACSECLAPDPVFSYTSALLTEPIELDITLPIDAPEGALISWTMDGSEPSDSSSLCERLQLHIEQTTVIRARVVGPDLLPARSVTRSYIFHPRQTDIPVISIVTDSLFLFGEELGILSGRVDDPEANFMKSWRRPLHIEYLAWDDKPNDVEICQLAECAVGGVSSRNFAQKSMKVYAHKRFGTKRLKGHLWEDKPGVDRVKSLMLRNGGSRYDGGKLHDALAQRIMGTNCDDLDWQAYEPVICYINGTYRGVYELRERSDEDYVEANHGVEKIVQNNRLYGGNAEWNALRMKAEAGASYEALDSLMDMEHWADYLAAEVFAANTDWPANNVFVWRPDTVGGKWRVILKDLDSFSYYATGKNFLNYTFLRGEEAEREKASGRYLTHSILCELNEREEFRQMFLHRMTVYLGDFLKPEVTLPIFENMAERIRPELSATKQAWGGSPSLTWVDHEWDSIRSYLRIRPWDVYEELNDYYELGGVIPMQVDAPDRTFVIDGISLRTGRFDGACFANEVVSVTTNTGERVHWCVKMCRADGSMTQEDTVGEVLALLPAAYGDDVSAISITADDDCAALQMLSDECRMADGVWYYTLGGIRCSGDLRGVVLRRKSFE